MVRMISGSKQESLTEDLYSTGGVQSGIISEYAR
jgi:hypothetical protein